MQDTLQIDYSGKNKPFYYIRLGALLSYIQDKLMYIVEIDTDNTSPLLKFDTEVETNLMFIENLQVSVDPNICLVNRTIKDFQGISYSFTSQEEQQAEPFESSLFTEHNCYGQIMNIYVNMRWILVKLDELKDTNTGKVVLIDFLNNILSSICSALGNINNLEATVDETTNTVIIRDKNPLPNINLVTSKLNSYYESIGSSKRISNESVTFDLFGYSTEEYSDTPVYNKMGHASFIKDFNFTTEITPQLSTMLTVGATANSEVVGENSTAFSRFNSGLTDRFKKNLTTPDTDSDNWKKDIFPAVLETTSEQEQTSDLNEEQKALVGQYADTYSRYLNYLRRLAKFEYNNNEAETYKNAVINFTTYLQQIRYIAVKKINLKSKPNYFLPSTGFIPFNMSLTMDGLSGMKIYNKFNINTEYLPTNYPETAEFLIKNITHKIENNKWNTILESIVISKGEYKNKNSNKIISDGSQNSTTDTSTPLKTSLGPDADFWSLVAISAAENYIDNPQGMADVAQSIYNRLKARTYGKSIKELIVSPGQYEPTFKNRNDWKLIKDEQTAIKAYQNSKKVSLDNATKAINISKSAITNQAYKTAAKNFVGSRTEFLASYPKDKDAADPVERSPSNKNNVFFWNYDGKRLFYNKKILAAQLPPSNLPQLA